MTLCNKLGQLHTSKCSKGMGSESGKRTFFLDLILSIKYAKLGKNEVFFAVK